MKDSHEWTDLPSSVSFTVEGHGKVTYDTGGAGPTINRVPGDWMLFPLRAVMDEILRLAGRVEEMETREQRSWTGLQMRRLEEREAEIALLRRERELLIVLEKERACVLDSVLNRGQVRASQLDRLADIMVAIQALHQEARGGVLLPEGVPCRCLLCRPGPFVVEGRPQLPQEIVWSHKDDPATGLCLPCGDPECRQPNCPTAQENAVAALDAAVARTGAPGNRPARTVEGALAAGEEIRGRMPGTDEAPWNEHSFVCQQCHQACDTIMGGRCAACARAATEARREAN